MSTNIEVRVLVPVCTSNLSKLRCISCISFQSSTNFLGLSWWLVWWPLLCVKSYFCPLRKGKERFQGITTDNQLITILGIRHLSPQPTKLLDPSKDQKCHFPVHPPCQVTASIQALQHPFDELDAIVVERDACQEKGCCHRSPSNQLLSISLNSESEGKVSPFNAESWLFVSYSTAGKIECWWSSWIHCFYIMNLTIRSDADTMLQMLKI